MTEETALTIPKDQALAALTDAEKFTAFYKRVRDQVMAHVPDVTTPAGRKAIASNAFKATKTKTALVKAANDLTEEWRANTAKVVTSRKKIEADLDALAVEARKPLTEWESAEDARTAKVDEMMNLLRQHAVVLASETSDEIETRMIAVSQVVIRDEEFQGFAEIARNLRTETMRALVAGKERALKAEADARELAELRAANEEREAADAAERDRLEAERLEREAEETRQHDEEQAETDRLAEAARQEQERLDEIARQEAAQKKAADDAAEAARTETERRANEALAASEAAHQAELAALQKKADADKAELARLAKEKSDLEAEQVAERAAQDKRNKDRAHKSTVMGEAKVSIAALFPPDIDEVRRTSWAIQVVRAIVADEIPHISIRF